MGEIFLDMDSYGGKLNKLVVHVVRMVHPIIL
jgi:hypothetical protein